MAWATLTKRTAEYLRKGRKVYFEGRLQTRQWEGQDGQKRYTTELIANTVTPLDRRPQDDGSGDFPGGEPVRAARPGRPAPEEAAPEAPTDYDDLPF